MPIINLPNVGVVSLDAIVKRAVVIEDAIAIRSMVNISMSWDHRVLDGELATRFLARVKQNLETWDFVEDLWVCSAMARRAAWLVRAPGPVSYDAANAAMHELAEQRLAQANTRHADHSSNTRPSSPRDAARNPRSSCGPRTR